MPSPRTARARRAALFAVLALSAVAGACSSGSDGASSPSSEPGTASSAAPSTSGAATSSSTGTGSSASSTSRAPTTSTSGPPTSASAATSAPATTAATAPGGPPFLDASAVAERDFPGSNTLAVLAAVRVGHQDGFDRVVFEFRDGDALPGYRVRFQDLPVHADPSDEVVALTGDGALVVRMQAASRFDFGAVPPAQYRGPSVVSGTTGTVTQAALAGDFEALLSWAIGVRGHPAFRVFELQGPPRIVVDVVSAG